MEQALATSGEVRLGTLEAAEPQELVSGATEIANVLAGVIDKQRLYVEIRGRKHVKVEGWTTLAAMLGVTAQEVNCIEEEDGSFVSTVELVRIKDNQVVGRASALCGMDEEWGDRQRYARKSMAATRATGKACRLAFSWIMALSGFDVTPAEEIPAEEKRHTPRQDSTQEQPTPSVLQRPLDVTQAVGRQLPAYDSLAVEPPQSTTVPADSGRDIHIISERQGKRLYAIWNKLGWTDTAAQDFIKQEWGYIYSYDTNSWNIETRHYEEIVKAIEEKS